MAVTHTSIQDDKSASRWKMSISFLTAGAPCKTQASLNVNGNSYNTRSHQSEQTSHPIFTRTEPQSYTRQDRVERWVASQALSLATETGTKCEPSKDSHAWYDSDHWLKTRRGGHIPTLYSRATVMFAEQRELNTNRIPLAGVQIVRSKASAFPKIERQRSPRYRYSFEEKLFIMHRRVVKSMDWSNIWKEYISAFGARKAHRTIRQMRSTYYRTRDEWGMDYVTKSGSGLSQNDMAVVQRKMGRFTTDRLSLLRAKDC